MSAPGRRGALALAAGLAAWPLAAPRLARAQSPVLVRDLLGREVRLPRPARRVVLGQGRHLLALNLLHPDPASLLAAWRDDLRRTQPADYAPFRVRFPALDALPTLGGAANDLPAERILAARPDLVLLSRWDLQLGGAATLPATLAAAGVPVAVVDFFLQPFRDTEPSLALLGALLGVEERAAALAAFRRERLEAVAARLAGAEPRSVLLHAHAGATPCCASSGRGTFDDILRLAGGASLGAELLPGPFGTLDPEVVLARSPAIYVATGGAFPGNTGVRVGAGVPEAEARNSLAQVLAASPLAALPGVRAGRAHALWHGFNDTPAHLLAVEALARWTQPERCRDLDPRATLAALNSRFAAVPMEGSYWADLSA